MSVDGSAAATAISSGGNACGNSRITRRRASSQESPRCSSHHLAREAAECSPHIAAGSHFNPSLVNEAEGRAGMKREGNSRMTRAWASAKERPRCSTHHLARDAAECPSHTTSGFHCAAASSRGALARMAAAPGIEEQARLRTRSKATLRLLALTLELLIGRLRCLALARSRGPMCACASARTSPPYRLAHKAFSSVVRCLARGAGA
mmetsp:Transcript_31968/g.80450  ORF Transcript_31968/g.80450 Transcript_31968/m.80450 type:complete len:207 (+) Transcript_31968:814-1434(+)